MTGPDALALLSSAAIGALALVVIADGISRFFASRRDYREHLAFERRAVREA